MLKWLAQSVRKNLTNTDLIILVALSLVVLLMAWRLIGKNSVPFEDGAILMRYSKHFAEGHGIVWNIGEKPVDGATDFLFMALLAVLAKTGLSLEHAVIFTGVGSHLLTVWVLYFTLRATVKCSTWIALVSALVLIVGPGLNYVALYFGTPFFALWAVIAWSIAFRMVLGTDPHRTLSCWFGVACLLMALTRPEGVFLSLFMLLSLVTYYRISRIGASRETILWFVTIFVLLGGSYFLWHWHYFGYPLPNPYYKKGGGHLHFDSFSASTTNSAKYISIYGLVFFAGLLNRTTRARSLFVLTPLLLFASIWITMSNEMNHLRRFQYVILPLTCLSWPMILTALLDLPAVQRRLESRSMRMGLSLLALAMVGITSAIQARQVARDTRFRTSQDDNYDIALALKRYSQEGYTLATSEAGLLPLYSDWRTVDAWGLNDAWIAHHGGVTEEYLNRVAPEVIIFHAASDPRDPLHFSPDQYWGDVGYPWYSMSVVLSRYAVQHQYRLVGYKQGGDPAWYYYYFVKPDFKDSRAIAQQLARILK